VGEGGLILYNFSTFPTPTHLTFTTQPIGSTPGSPLLIQPVVALQDRQGRLISTVTKTVTLNITPNTGTNGATLGGVTSHNTLNGSASFNGLSINKSGVGYTLTASSDSLLPAISHPFDIGRPLTVTVATDDGTGNTPGTLSAILPTAQSGDIITFNLPANALNKVTLAHGFTLPTGVSLVANCSNRITLDGGGSAGNGLILQGGNTLNGLKITGFSGILLKVPAGSGSNNLICTSLKKVL
jgi:hypothetical protein